MARPGVTELEVELDGDSAPAWVSRLAADPGASRLRSLVLRCWSGLDHLRGLPDLLASPHLTNLTHLGLHGHDIGNEEAELVAASSSLPALTSYASEGIQLPAASVVDDRGATALANAPVIRFTELRLPSHSVGPEGVAAIANGPATAGLRVLDLSGNRIGLEGLEALVEAPGLGALNRLEIAGAPMTAALAEALNSRYPQVIRHVE